MKRIILVLVCLTMLFNCSLLNAGKKKTFADLLHAIHMVESGGRLKDVPNGDGGDAIGPFQIHKEYWQDAVQFRPNIGGKYSDCNGYEYSVKVVDAYLTRYGKDFRENENWEALARIHNGGPKGFRIKATIGYWKKVQKHL